MLDKDIESVFECICSCEIGTYMSAYSPSKAVINSSDIVSILWTTRYKARKYLKSLEAMGLIEKASVGFPALVSYGEYTELISDAMPPRNGYGITQRGFESECWKRIYREWEKSLEELANGEQDFWEDWST